MDGGFGSSADDSEVKRPTMAVPGRCANVIDLRLQELARQGPPEPPLIWLDGPDDAPWSNAAEWREWFGADVSLVEAWQLGKIFDANAAEFYRRALICARESDGTEDDYFLRCEVEGAKGIDPILKRNIT